MKQILQVDTNNLDALYLGADLKAITDVDTLQNKSDEAVLVSHSKYTPYKDVDYVQSEANGELLAKSGGILEAYPARYKLRMTENVYTGNKSHYAPYYVYTAQRAGMYLVNCDIAIHSTTYTDQSIGAIFTNTVISSYSGMVGLWMLKNGTAFGHPGIDSIGVYDTYDPPRYYYKYDFYISKTWNVYLNAGDKIHFETNIYEIATPDPYTFYLWGTAKINYYGTKEEDTHAI
jgi:hypothetical protein